MAETAAVKTKKPGIREVVRALGNRKAFYMLLFGIASGLPGPAGLHGTRASGVVSTAEYFGQSFENPLVPGEIVEGNAYTGLILAHEIGHYLGLFHTSEIDGSRHDPIADTPECAPEDFPLACPDLGNLMFPLAVPGNDALTAGQAHTVRASPLTKD